MKCNNTLCKRHLTNGECVKLVGEKCKYEQAKEIIKTILKYFPDYEAKNFEDMHLLNALYRAEQFLRETDIDDAIQKANEGLDLDKIADEVEQDIKEQNNS